MQLVVLDGVEPGSVVRAVGARTYARGVLLAQRRAVVEMEGDATRAALYTEVRDGRADHEAVARLRARGARWEFVGGTCTCRVGANCAHVVASVLTAARDECPGAVEQHPPWERTLHSLFAPD